MSTNLKRKASDEASNDGSLSEGSVKKIKVECEQKPTCKLVSLTVTLNAAQKNVIGDKNWACVKKATDDVIVQATTTPNTEACWNQITWSGDSGTSVPGHANQRKLSRAASQTYHVQASLGGVSDHVDVWVLWATVTIEVSGTTPPNAAVFGGDYDGTEKLGAVIYKRGKGAAGKVVPVATITPAGVHQIVKSGWTFKRERMSHDWDDGAKSSEGNGVDDYWNTAWVDDTSLSPYLKLKPDNDDKIYDSDGPNIGGFGKKDAESYNNFQQWIEWRNEVCSDKSGWYWQGRWQKSKNPQVLLADVGIGNIVLPDTSHFHP